MRVPIAQLQLRLCLSVSSYALFLCLVPSVGPCGTLLCIQILLYDTHVIFSCLLSPAPPASSLLHGVHARCNMFLLTMFVNILSD